MRIRCRQARAVLSIFLLVMTTFFCQLSPVEAASIVRTDKDIYQQGERIRVHFSNSPGLDRDWMCIVPAGSPDTDAGDYKYMPRGLRQGSLLFDPRSPGKYEVRAYYNYRRYGYVVSGRHAFSVVSDPAKEEAFIPSASPMDSSQSSEISQPPPIPFVAPPNVVVLPGTDIYAVPDIEQEIFFQAGWWWRPWGDHWYRSRYYDHGWVYYRDAPLWYRKIPQDWRHHYRNHIWGDRPWNPHIVQHGGIDGHWRGGHWRSDHGLAGHGKPTLHGGGPGGGKPSGGKGVGGKSGGDHDKPALHNGGLGGGTHPDERTKGSHGEAPHRGDRR